MRKGLLLATSALFVSAVGCGSKARPDPSSSSGPAASATAASASATNDKSAPSSSASASTTPRPGATDTAIAAASASPAAASASAEADAVAAPWKCGETRFENVGAFHSGPQLYAPMSRAELPAPLQWHACGSGPADCSELDLGAASDANVALDLATARGPLFIVWGGTPLCSYVLSVDPDGNVQTAIELHDPSNATLDNMAVGQGAFMSHVSIIHVGETPSGGWLIGSAAMPPATAMAEDGEETNDAISDKLWFDAKKGTLGILGSAKSKGKFDKVPKSYAVVQGSVLALYEDGAKISVLSTVPSDKDETDVVSADAGHHIVSFDASPKLLAWVDSSGSECVLHMSPFALTPMGRSAPLKPKELGSVPCDAGSPVTIERGWILVGNDIIHVADGKRVPLASTICGADAKPACVRDSILGVSDTNVYFRSSGKIRRAPIASVGGSPPSAPSKP